MLIHDLNLVIAAKRPYLKLQWHINLKKTGNVIRFIEIGYGVTFNRGQTSKMKSRFYPHQIWAKILEKSIN